MGGLNAQQAWEQKLTTQMQIGFSVLRKETGGPLLVAGLSADDSDKVADWLTRNGRRSELLPATLEGITSRL